MWQTVNLLWPTPRLLWRGALNFVGKRPSSGTNSKFDVVDIASVPAAVEAIEVQAQVVTGIGSSTQNAAPRDFNSGHQVFGSQVLRARFGFEPGSERAWRKPSLLFIKIGVTYHQARGSGRRFKWTTESITFDCRREGDAITWFQKDSGQPNGRCEDVYLVSCPINDFT